MHVAFVTHSLSRKGGGLLDSVRRLSQSLAARPGVRVSVTGLEDEFASADLPLWAPLDPVAQPVFGPCAFGWAPGMRATLRDWMPDIVHPQGLWMFTSLACMHHARKTGRPEIITTHGMLDPWALANSRWKKRVASLLYENAHLRAARCLHALSRSEAESIRALGLRNPVCQIPNGIDLPEAPADQPPPWHGQIDPARKTILFLARIHPKKGLPALVKGWARFKKSAGASDWALAIAGWDQGGHEPELRELVRETGLDRDVVFVGPRFGADKAAALHHAAAFVLPSLSEGLPMAVLEAWAYARPVLMTDACNLPEGFAHDAALRIMPEPESIARGLESFTALSPAERDAMGRRGRSLVEAEFAWDRIAARMEAVYRWLLGGGDPPPDVALGAQARQRR